MREHSIIGQAIQMVEVYIQKVQSPRGKQKQRAFIVLLLK